MTNLRKFLHDWREIGIQGRSLTDDEIVKVVSDWLKQKRQEEIAKYTPPVLSVYDDLLKELSISVPKESTEAKL